MPAVRGKRCQQMHVRRRPSPCAKKLRVRSLRGLPINSSGRPSLDDTAFLHEQDTVCGLARKTGPRGSPPPWSCPVRRGPSITFSTSPTISGSSAEVGSSNSMTAGCIASAPRDRHALLLAAGEPCRRIGRLLVGEADPAPAGAWRRFSATARGVFSTCTGPHITFSKAVMWLKRLNCWNTMPTWRRWRDRPGVGERRARPAAFRRHAQGCRR